MKKLLVLTFLCSILSGFSQITLEKSGTTLLETIKKSNGEIVFYQKITDNNNNFSSLKIYNEDLTLFKTVNLSNIPSKWISLGQIGLNHQKFQINSLLLSDNLFNSDSKLEFIVNGKTASFPDNSEHAYFIINEDGVVLQTINADLITNYGQSWSSATLYQKSNGLSYLGLQIGETTMNHYKLNGDYVTSIVAPFSSDVKNTASVYPNPASNYIKLDYTIPKNLSVVSLKIYDINGAVIKEMTADGITGFVVVDINELQNGNYIMKTLNGEELLASSKFVVIK